MKTVLLLFSLCFYSNSLKWHSKKHKKSHQNEAKDYKSYCASEDSPNVLILKCEDDCYDPKIHFIDFASFGNPKGECPHFESDYCGLDEVSLMNDICRNKRECKVAVNSGHLGKPDCHTSNLKVVFTCQCSREERKKEKQKSLTSDGDKTFLEQLEKVYSPNLIFYFHLDKEGTLQVVNTDTEAVKYSKFKAKDRGVGPFMLDLSQKGELTIRDKTDEVVYTTDTGNRGRAPYSLVVTDEGRLILQDSVADDIWKSPK